MPRRSAPRVEPGVGAGVENEPRLQLCLLGPLAVRRGDVALALPASRKVRALLAYLALAPRPLSRDHLCELFWDVPNDPRGELRWCLSKIRRMVDSRDRRRVETEGETVRIDLSGCEVDVLEIAHAAQAGLEGLPAERLRELAALLDAGDFLEGLALDSGPELSHWLGAQRRRLRGCHAAVLEQLAKSAVGGEVFAQLEKWLALAPFDRRAHEALFAALARAGRIREGEEHLESTSRAFESEGLDRSPLRQAWRLARAAAESAPPSRAIELEMVERPEPRASGPHRASVAVMPFADESPEARLPGGGPAEGLALDVLTRLAKLRSLFVIARGTVFALHERGIAPEAAGRMLDVDYMVAGSLARRGKRLRVSVELSETRSARIVWAEVFDREADDAFAVIDEIGNRIVASVAHEIEAAESARAILRPPSSLDAWEAHHRGLWHMYRFNRADNERAQQFFQTALGLDPTFARAHAGLSFTHFQNAFLDWGERGPEIERAYATAGQSLLADDRDPAAHWAMGRALWLRGSHPQSLAELERAVDLSPNFALAHYTLAFVHSQAGDAQAAIEFSDHSRVLSPFDPLLFAMLGARAMGLARLGRFDEAAESGAQAAARPNAHEHVVAIGAYTLALAGRLAEARAHMAAILKRRPDYRIADFLRAMHFEADGEALFRRAAEVVK
ncbi:MAG TPA: transcriptional regulator [Myxococcota bacterium]|nr:transcriptional regulator [Myxococcota bacterium]